eukprot:263977-Rhodomonas_salina.12
MSGERTPTQTEAVSTSFPPPPFLGERSLVSAPPPSSPVTSCGRASFSTPVSPATPATPAIPASPASAPTPDSAPPTGGCAASGSGSGSGSGWLRVEGCGSGSRDAGCWAAGAGVCSRGMGNAGEGSSTLRSALRLSVLRLLAGRSPGSSSSLASASPLAQNGVSAAPRRSAPSNARCFFRAMCSAGDFLLAGAGDSSSSLANRRSALPLLCAPAASNLCNDVDCTLEL